MKARQRAQSLAAGQGDCECIAVPLAMAPAARIQERDWQDFTEDPTQLANGLRDLFQAVSPDGLTVSEPLLLLEQGDRGLLNGPHAHASIEATRRLRLSLGDEVALVACLPGLADADAADLLATGKEFLAAGVDVILLFEEDPGSAPELNTLANVARFHQGVVMSTGPSPTLLRATSSALDSPTVANALVITDTWLPRETDLVELEEWIEAVRG